MDFDRTTNSGLHLKLSDFLITTLRAKSIFNQYAQSQVLYKLGFTSMTMGWLPLVASNYAIKFSFDLGHL